MAEPAATVGMHVLSVAAGCVLAESAMLQASS